MKTNKNCRKETNKKTQRRVEEKPRKAKRESPTSTSFEAEDDEAENESAADEGEGEMLGDAGEAGGRRGETASPVGRTCRNRRMGARKHGRRKRNTDDANIANTELIFGNE